MSAACHGARTPGDTPAPGARAAPGSAELQRESTTKGEEGEAGKALETLETTKRFG